MKKCRRVLAQMLILAIMVVMFTGCGSGDDTSKSGEKRTLRIGSTQVYTTALMSIAIDQKFLDECLPEGVDYTFNKLATGPDCRDALISSQIDLCDMATMTYMMSLENDLPITPICATGSTPIYLYSCNKDIKSIKDFKSTNRIAITNRATTLHVAFLGVCKDKLGDAKVLDSCLVPIPAADALAALSTKSDFDGAIFSFPNKVKADQLENLTLLEDMTDIINKYGDGGLLVTRDDYVKENKDIFDGYIASLKKAKQFVEEKPDEAAEILSKVYGVEPKYIKEAFAAMPPDYIVKNYDELGTLLYESGALTKEPAKFSEIKNYENIPKE